MNVLVTGAAGLIGSHLVDKLLLKGFKVTGIDDLSYGSKSNLNFALSNKNFTFIKNKIEKLNLIDEKFDFIFHFASLKKVWDKSITSNKVIEVNFNMTKSVLDKSLKDNSYLIFASTSDIYGNSINFCEDEDIVMPAPNSSRYSYALSKLHSEQFILNASRESNLDACVVRIFGCASERSNMSWSGGHVPFFVNLAMNNKDITIHGDGMQTRSISHASEIAEGFLQIISKSDSCKSNIINLGTSQETTVKEIAEYIIKKTNSESKIFYDRNINSDYKEIKRRYANTTKAKNILNFNINIDTYDVVDNIIEKFGKEFKNE